jgi:hypothetical protein
MMNTSTNITNRRLPQIDPKYKPNLPTNNSGEMHIQETLLDQARNES